MEVLPLYRFEEQGVFKAEQSPFIIRLLWLCGCVSTISWKQAQMLYGMSARESFHCRISSSHTEYTEETSPKLEGSPNICDLKPSSHITGYVSRCLKFSTNYTTAFISTLDYWLSLINSLPFGKTILEDIGCHSHEIKGLWAWDGCVYLWVPSASVWGLSSLLQLYVETGSSHEGFFLFCSAIYVFRQGLSWSTEHIILSDLHDSGSPWADAGVLSMVTGKGESSIMESLMTPCLTRCWLEVVSKQGQESGAQEKEVESNRAKRQRAPWRHTPEALGVLWWQPDSQ